MASSNLHHLPPSFQEFELQFQNLEGLIFETYIKNCQLRDAWRQILLDQVHKKA